MSKERRQLEDWEKAECAALKSALAEYNSALPKEKRYTQDDLSHLLGMSQGTLSSHLNGHRAINIEMAANIYRLLGIPVERFSERIAEAMASLAGVIVREFPERDAAEPKHNAVRAREMAIAASPRSRSALEKIAEAADSGVLSEEDVLLLEMIATRLASQGAEAPESPHQRLRKNLKRNDPVPEQ